MMKCENCGGNLTLEDVVCPHCDAVNPHAIQHIRDMKRYEKEFSGTKKDVYSVTKNYTGNVVRVVIIALLIIMTVICGVVSGKSYSIHRRIVEAESNKNAATCKAQINEYLENREYYALSIYFEEKHIETYDSPFEEYGVIEFAASKYRYIYSTLMGTMKPYDDDLSEEIRNIASYLGDFYEVYDEDSYRYMGTSEMNKKAIAGMEEQIYALLQGYCGLTAEDIQALPTMSEAERALVIEEGMKDGK